MGVEPAGEAGLEFGELLRKGVGLEQCGAHPYEGADDEHTRGSGALALEDIGRLEGVVLGEGIGGWRTLRLDAVTNCDRMSSDSVEPVTFCDEFGASSSLEPAFASGVTICDLKDAVSSDVSWNRNSAGKRRRLRLTA